MKKRIFALSILSFLVFGCANKSVPTYTVTWLDYDGTVLEVDNKVKKNSWPHYDGDIPTREQDAQYTYTFNGWSPEIEAVRSNVTYTAVYSEEIRSYTISWVVNGATVRTETLNYGEMPRYIGSIPSKASTAEHTYTFTGWSPEVTAVTGDATYTAVFQENIRQYTVTWIIDGATVRTESVNYGTRPSWGSSDPSKDSTDQYTYTFNGWDRDLNTPITGDTTIRGSFTAHVRSYTVTFKDDDGTVLDTQTLEYGATPVCDYEFTIKTDDNYNYAFSNWNHDIAPVTGNATYTAVYTKSPCNFVENDNGTMSVRGLKNNNFSGRITIPEYWCGKPVTGIWNNAFINIAGITKVILPSTMTSIGSGAFSNSGITSIDMSNTQITVLKYMTFFNCDNLTEVKFPNNLQTIEYECFRMCDQLHHIEFPDSITSIGNYAFESCTQLYSLQFGPSYQYSFLGNNVFSYCGALTEVIYTGDSIQGVNGYDLCILKSIIGEEQKGDFVALESVDPFMSMMTYKAYDSEDYVIVGAYGPVSGKLYFDGMHAIKDYAFCNCDLVEEVRISVAIEEARIGDGAFAACPNLKSVSFISDVPFDVPQYCFDDCPELTTVDFGTAQVKRIGAQAFASCHKLANVTFPTTLEQIDNEAFNNCILTSVSLPASLTVMDQNPFIYCPVTAFVVDANNPNFTVVDGVIYSKDMKRVVAYPGGATATTYTVPNGVTTLGRYSIAFINALQTVNLPSSITRMEQQWLIASNNITSLTFAGTVEQCGEILGIHGWWRSWDQQQNLTTITCSNGVYNLDD